MPLYLVLSLAGMERRVANRGREIPRRGVHGVEGEAVQRVGDGLGLAVDVDDLDVGGRESGRESGRALRRLARPVEVRRAERLGCKDVLVAERALRELGRDVLDGFVQGLLPIAAPSVASQGGEDPCGELTSNSARYGRCQVRKRMDECVQ